MSGQSDHLQMEVVESCDKSPLYAWPSAFNDFSKLPNQVGDKVSSTPYKMGSYEFQIDVYPGGLKEEDRNYVSIFLRMCNPSTTARIKFRIFILDVNGCKELGLGRIDSFCEFCTHGDHLRTSWGVGKSILRADLLSRVLLSTNDQLIVLTEISHIDEPDFLSPLDKFCKHGKHFNDQKFSDVKIIVKDKTIHAHKLLLSDYDVFVAMFEHDMREKKENVIHIEDFEFEVILELIRFIYTGKVHNIGRIVQDLLIAADKYDIKELKTECTDYLCRTLSTHNVLQLMNFADQYNAEKLEKETFTFFTTHRKDVSKIPNFEARIKDMDADVRAKLIIFFAIS
ncbi:hypothetical protein QAD02_011099 [Eretmocerus hayati]|uniref:Uncharacterized protein n=1 Tax=Eretmocerus hayati TaxID=131215 RepID=A0ACC2NWR9_9HYME|nr:hypothetical protein QAD02_011099 [Eretmocerus hayati]